MTTAAIVVAGGSGTRMQSGVNKVFLPLGGRSILEWSLAIFEGAGQVDEIVLVVRASDLADSEPLRRRFRKLDRVVAGGDVRHRSEMAGLTTLAGRIDAGQVETVIVHDAARPFASRILLEKVVRAAGQQGAAVPGLMAPASLVYADEGWVTGYPSNLWMIQTPQAFRAQPLLAAHRRAASEGFLGTDTASVIEWAGGAVAVVTGEPENLKITVPADFRRAQEIVARGK